MNTALPPTALETDCGHCRNSGGAETKKYFFLTFLYLSILYLYLFLCIIVCGHIASKRMRSLVAQSYSKMHSSLTETGHVCVLNYTTGI